MPGSDDDHESALQHMCDSGAITSDTREILSACLIPVPTERRRQVDQQCSRLFDLPALGAAGTGTSEIDTSC